MNRLALREGWSTFILTSLVVFVAVWSIRQADWADGLQILNRSFGNVIREQDIHVVR